MLQNCPSTIYANAHTKLAREDSLVIRPRGGGKASPLGNILFKVIHPLTLRLLLVTDDRKVWKHRRAHYRVVPARNQYA
jgi:hypothetical protein